MTTRPWRTDISDSDDTVTLPSGAHTSLRRPNFPVCSSSEDFLELRCALMEKIIGIELQIDLHNSGTGNPDCRSGWLARANAALKWTKLYRDECQQRQGLFSKTQREAAQEQRNTKFVTAAKSILPPKTFAQILVQAGYADDAEAFLEKQQ